DHRASATPLALCPTRPTPGQAHYPSADPEYLSFPPGRYPSSLGRLTLVAPTGGRSTANAEPPETKAEDPRGVGGLADRGSRKSGRVLCLGGFALGRPFDAGGAPALPRSGVQHAVAGPADLSPGVSPALGQPLASQPPHAGPLRAQ